MMFAQIITDVNIANWIIAILMGVVCFLLKNQIDWLKATLEEFKKDFRQLEDKLNEEKKTNIEQAKDIQNFRDILRKAGYVILILLLFSSCSVHKKLSTHDASTSASTASVAKHDSVIYHYKETIKQLPADTSSFAFTQAVLDSLLKGIRALPSGSRTIVLNDASTGSATGNSAQLQLVMDELNNLKINCIAAGGTWSEKEISYQQKIKQLETLVQKATQEKTTEQSKDKNGLTLWVILGIVAFAFFLWLLDKIPFIKTLLRV